jgi:hypothetical protein
MWRIVNRFGIGGAAGDERDAKYRAMRGLDLVDQFAQRRPRDTLDGLQSHRHDACTLVGRQLEVGMPGLMRFGDRGIPKLQTFSR